MTHAVRLVLAFLIALLAACADRGGGREDPPSSSVVDTWLWWIPEPSRIDLLFVVDDSSSMAGEQAALAAGFPALVDVLEGLEGGLPDLHIGVVSTNVGAAGQPGVAGCGRAGDDGRLQVPAACTGLDGSFISDLSDRRGGRIRNYAGELDERFACLAQLGTDGCGFEMPLEAMYRALQPGVNPGFLRDDAYLAVVFVTDEDDCSTDEASLFGDPTAGLDSPLGPFTSFRCFEHGVECDGDADPRAFGPRTGCRPRVGSPLIAIERYVSFLKGLKPDPSLVIVSGIVGVDDAAHTVVVGPDATEPTRPAVRPSCIRADDDDGGGATPPIRLEAFLRSFANRNSRASICGDNLTDIFVNLAGRGGHWAGPPCLRHALADVAPAQPGLQPQCSVSAGSGRPQDPDTVVRPCAEPGGDPACWELVADPSGCPETPDHLRFRVHPDGPDGIRGFFRAQCLVR